MRNFISSEQEKDVIKAIELAEKDTSGEIRVHVEDHCKEEVLDRASDVFAELHMHKTGLRNGVLFYFAVKDKKFAILGDGGINAVVPPDFWDTSKEIITNHFQEKKFAEGLVKAIELAGEQLKKHFPYQQNDSNELSNDISFGK
jgi:uncharacterized membrane protein